MSTAVYADNELRVGRFCGPSGPADRMLWQFTVGDDCAHLRFSAVLELALALLASVAADGEEVRVDFVKPRGRRSE